ncbi:helix-turn-helix transcriptional regulator [uncultured Phascolarctobacterium sp.]|uniref:helix-turn-helix transcriptional regulator n=1 Tax=uncultured Phascolarctobacterium sp. TaxID=512296 RepID=UPI002639971C|nr:helix-turn-helix transcriptional regulator [uncultured Phascolarctobacterium sp.]
MMEVLDTLKVGETIKIKRIQKRITQAELAKQLGVSQTHLSNAENGRVLLSLRGFLKLKVIFDCTLDELVEPDDGSKWLKGGIRAKKYRLVRCED